MFSSNEHRGVSHHSKHTLTRLEDLYPNVLDCAFSPTTSCLSTLAPVPSKSRDGLILSGAMLSILTGQQPTPPIRQKRARCGAAAGCWRASQAPVVAKEMGCLGHRGAGSGVAVGARIVLWTRFKAVVTGSTGTFKLNISPDYISLSPLPHPSKSIQLSFLGTKL